MRILIKLGGTLLDSVESRERLAREIADATADHKIVVVHGGGRQMTRYLEERGVESRFVNGLRVTTDEVLDAVLKIFAGSVNATLVSAFRKSGARPVGLSGLDAGLVDAEVLNPELGHVGRPLSSDARLLELLTGSGYLPVVACVAGDAQGRVYNVNGDQMAAACAAAFQVEKLIFLTDVEGVRDGNSTIRSVLSMTEADELIRDRVATGGMQAKLEAAISALRNGVREIVIAPGAYFDVIGTLMSNQAIGSRVTL